MEVLVKIAMTMVQRAETMSFQSADPIEKNMYQIKLYVHDAVNQITFLMLLDFLYKGY